jgi:hypothetical protein
MIKFFFFRKISHFYFEFSKVKINREISLFVEVISAKIEKGRYDFIRNI